MFHHFLGWHKRFFYGLLMGIWLIVVLVTTAGLSPSLRSAQGSTLVQATIAEILDGRQVFIQNQVAMVGAIARQGQQVSTQQARAQLNFSNGAIVRLGKNSVLTVGSECAQVSQGRLLVNGSLNGCTSSIVAGVRGTVYLLSVEANGDQQVDVLEGEVEVSSLKQPGEVLAFQAFRLRSGQRAALDKQRRLRFVRQMTAQEYDEILTGNFLNDFRNDLPEHNKIRQRYLKLFPGRRFPPRRQVTSTR